MSASQTDTQTNDSHTEVDNQEVAVLQAETFQYDRYQQNITRLNRYRESGHHYDSTFGLSRVQIYEPREYHQVDRSEYPRTELSNQEQEAVEQDDVQQAVIVGHNRLSNAELPANEHYRVSSQVPIFGEPAANTRWTVAESISRNIDLALEEGNDRVLTHQSTPLESPTHEPPFIDHNAQAHQQIYGFYRLREHSRTLLQPGHDPTTI